MREAPFISVIVAHYNDPAGLALTLQSLTELDSRTPAFEVVVADNASSFGLAAVHAITALFVGLDIHVVEEPRAGAAHARNAGVAVARGSLLAFLDCDCIPQSDWLLRAAVHLSGGSDIVGGPLPMCLRPGAKRAETAAEMFDFLYACDVAHQYRRNGLLLTANLIVRKQCFTAVGGFRGLVPEDRDWCDRARAIAFRARFDHDLVVRHVATSAENAQRQRWRRRTREAWHYHQHQGGSRVVWLAYCGAVLLSPFIHIIRVAYSPATRAEPLRLKLATIRLLLTIRWERTLLGLRLAMASARNESSTDHQSPRVADL